MSHTTRSAYLALGLVLAVLAAGAVGCSKKASQTETVTPPVQVEPARPAEPSRPAPPVSEPSVELSFDPAFFDFDKYNIRADARDALTHNAKLLMDHPEARIVIEGHCDERGTREYNLALGDRRARAAKDFLVRFGVEEARIEVISYGEERPFAAGHNETAWQQNRRAHFRTK